MKKLGLIDSKGGGLNLIFRELVGMDEHVMSSAFGSIKRIHNDNERVAIVQYITVHTIHTRI